MKGQPGLEHPGTHVEAAVHGFAKPDVLLLLALAAPPVLLWHSCWIRVDTSLACLHVAENFHSVQGAALVGVDPVVSCGRRGSIRSGSHSNLGKVPTGKLGQGRVTCGPKGARQKASGIKKSVWEAKKQGQRQCSSAESTLESLLSWSFTGTFQV